MSGRYAWEARPLGYSGFTMELVAEQASRHIAAGYISSAPLRHTSREDRDVAVQQLRALWWPYDAEDYAPEAPGVMPAGSCVSDDFIPEQRAFYRERA